jgi:hypothetical protein
LILVVEDTARGTPIDFPALLWVREPSRPLREDSMIVDADKDLDAKIRARAHEIWEHEGRPTGRAEMHWEQAKREIEFEAARSKPAEQTADSGSASSFPKSRARKRA